LTHELKKKNLLRDKLCTFAWQGLSHWPMLTGTACGTTPSSSEATVINDTTFTGSTLINSLEISPWK